MVARNPSKVEFTEVSSGGQVAPGGGELPGALAHGVPRGRGAGLNPGNRFEESRGWVSTEFLEELRQERAEGVEHAGGSAERRVPLPQQARLVATQVLDDASRSIINKVDSPDIPFAWSLNPYRGCEHGCVYCYARPTHEYLGMSCGLDFETRILAKPDAPELLRRELSRPSWQGETIVMSGVTDCYQPAERELQITRRCLEVMLEFRQSVSIITKSRLVLRDLDLLRELARLDLVHVAMSITTLDHALAARMEPRASSPSARLDAVRALSRAGVPVMVMTAPIIPAINDHEVPALLREASGAGAQAAAYIMLRLPHQVKALFLEWLRRHVPTRAARVESLLRASRGGELSDSRPGVRMRGEGALADALNVTFHTFRRKYRLAERLPAHDTSRFRRVEAGQGVLFG